ncbi:hypothetical protein FIU92_13385 [Ruegeria sp. THAF33]|nr:hypothetical protein FIU92_13385 [Ruegeria sp. THAF33]
MINARTQGHATLTLMRLRENLSASLSDAEAAGPAGITYVLQQPSGAVYTDRAGAWTFDLSLARGFQQGAAPILGARVMEVEAARAVIVAGLKDHLSQIDELLEVSKGTRSV